MAFPPISARLPPVLESQVGGPFSSRGSATRGGFTAGGFGSNWGTPSSTPGSGDPFLNKALGMKITDEERQEGYDFDLLNSLPRTGEANASTATARPSVQLPGSGADGGKPVVPASSRPYVSREVTADNGVRVKHPVDQRKARATKDTRRSSPKKKKLVWYQDPKIIAAVVAALVTVGLAIGLGVGLGVKRSGTASSADAGTSTRTTPIIQVSATSSSTPTSTGGDVGSDHTSIVIQPTSLVDGR